MGPRGKIKVSAGLRSRGLGGRICPLPSLAPRGLLQFLLWL